MILMHEKNYQSFLDFEYDKKDKHIKYDVKLNLMI